MSAYVSSVSDDSFEKDVLQSTEPVLVDFWAEWCGPCRMMSPVLDHLAEESAGKLKIVKLNIDENPLIPAKFSIRGIPTMILFKDGKAVASQVGAVAKTQLAALVRPHLAAAA